VAEATHPEKIILFGSYAYGQPNEDSDIDLLLIHKAKTKTARRGVSLRASDVLDPRPFPVDIIVRSPSEIFSRIKQGDFFLQEIMEKGSILFER